MAKQGSDSETSKTRLDEIEAAQLILALCSAKEIRWTLIESKEVAGCGFLAPHNIYERYRTIVSTPEGSVEIFLEYRDAPECYSDTRSIYDLTVVQKRGNMGMCMYREGCFGLLSKLFDSLRGKHKRTKGRLEFILKALTE